MLVAFFEAQHINIHSGGAVIAPWDLLEGYSVDEWADAAKQLSDVPNIRRKHKAEQAYFEKIRESHPNYKKYHYRKVN